MQTTRHLFNLLAAAICLAVSAPAFAASDPYKCTVTGITALASDKSNAPSAEVDNNVDVNDIENTYGNGINVIVGSYTNDSGELYYQYVAFDEDGVQTFWDAAIKASNVDSPGTTWYVGTLASPEKTTQTTEQLLANAESATLPLNESVTLTDADAYQTKAGRTPNYGKAYKVTLKKDEILNASFAGAGSTHVGIFSYDSTNDEFIQIGWNYNSLVYQASAAAESGTEYYLLLEPNSAGTKGTYTASISVSKVMTLSELLASAEEVTKSTEETVSLDGDYVEADTNISYDIYHGKAYKFTVASSSLVSVTLSSASIDAVLALYDASGNYVSSVDYHSDSAESMAIADAGTYYLVARGYYAEDAGEETISFTFRKDTGWLDFTDPGNLPAKDAAGGKWSWDGTTSTLTLEDGFSVSSLKDDGSHHDGAIILPGGSTIKVNGTANVVSGYNDGIYCTGDLAVELGNGAQLIIDAEDDDGIYADNLTISSADASSPGTISINADYEGIQCDAFTAENSTLEITSELEEGIYASYDLTATNCIFSISAQENCLESGYESISLTNCESVLRTNRNYNVIDAEKDITVTGGSLYAVGESNDVIYVADGSISITDTKLDLTCADGYDVIKGMTLTSLSIGAPFRLYDANGGELYQGSYSNSLLTTESGGSYKVLTVNGTSPTRLVSTFTVTFTDENGQVLSTQTVEWQSAATAPATPTKDGYTLVWYTDKALTQAYDLSQGVTGNLTLYAGWTRNTYTVVFVNKYGSTQDTVQVAPGETVSRPADPTLDGYTFIGWYADASFTTPYDFSAGVTSNTAIYARYMQDAAVKAYRKVKISAADGMTTTPGAGTYYVAGSQDFTFTAVFANGEVQKVFATGYYSEKTVELEATKLADGSYQYTLHKVTEPWTITFGSASNAGETGTEAVAETKIWSYGNALHISAASDTNAAIYSITGALVKTLRLTAGEATETLERGVYIVKAGGKTAKVVIK